MAKLPYASRSDQSAGWAAYGNNLPRNACPYHHKTQWAWHWLKGWDNAKKTDQERQVKEEKELIEQQIIQTKFSDFENRYADMLENLRHCGIDPFVLKEMLDNMP